MDHIIALLGEAGCGKSAVAKELESQGFNIIQSYTTRPPREPGEWGHIFLDIKDVVHNGELQTEGCIGFGRYHGHLYWSKREHYQGKGQSVYPLEPAGLKRLRQEVTDAKITAIYLSVDHEVRFSRLYERIRLNHEHTALALEETRVQMEYDSGLFAVVQCDYVINANDQVHLVAQRVVRAVRESSIGEDT